MVWTLVSATCSLHLTVSPLIDVCTMRSGFSPCAYTDASPGVESLVGREFAQSLGARLLMSVVRAVGAIFAFVILLTIT